MIHSFLLIGQSNAAGCGFLNEAEPLDNMKARIKMARNGLWIGMFRPVNPDRVTAGVCFAERFAREYALAHEDVNVGIIPCADGGTRIAQWLPGEVLFENAVNCAKLAMRSSTLKAILWHQGEADCSPEKCELYEERFKTVMNALREELGCPDIPIIIGGLGDFLKDFGDKNIAENYTNINATLKKLGSEYHNCAFVSAEGLGANPDNLHFSAAAQNEFGLRYYQAFEEFDKAEELATDGNRAEKSRSEMEML